MAYIISHIKHSHAISEHIKNMIHELSFWGYAIYHLLIFRKLSGKEEGNNSVELVRSVKTWPGLIDMRKHMTNEAFQRLLFLILSS